MRAIANIHRFEPGTNMQAWLFTILRNLFHSEYRKRRREVEDADGKYAATLAEQTPERTKACRAPPRIAVCGLEDPRELGRPLVEGASSSSYDSGRGGSTSLGRAGRAATDLGPPPLHGGEVPQQVGGAPVGARRHARLGVARGQDLAEARGLGADVVEVGLGWESGHTGTVCVLLPRRASIARAGRHGCRAR